MYRRQLLAGGVTLFAVGLAAWLVSPAVALSGFERLSTPPLLFAAGVLGVAVIRPICAWPTLLLSVGIGHAYGFAGLPLALVALVFTSLLPYRFGTVVTRDGRLTATGQRFIAETGGVRGVTAARLLPLPSDTISVAAGAVGVPLGPFLAGTLLGELPWAVLGILVGRSVDLLTTGELSGVVDPWLLAGMSAVAVLLVAGPCYRLFAADETTDTALPE